MPVPKTLKAKIKRAISKEYPRFSQKRKEHIINAVIYHNLGYGRGKK